MGYDIVRCIAGTLIRVGQGRLGAGAVSRILATRDRKAAGPVAPPHGLVLLRVGPSSPRSRRAPRA